MNLKSAYDLGQRVWLIRNRREEYRDPCGFCGGTGKINGADGAKRHCPECFGRGGKRAWRPTKWLVDGQLTIGEVRIKVRCDGPAVDGHEMFDNFGEQKAMREVDYMCRETGIGSGSVWKEAVLFPNQIAAQKECDKLNAGTREAASWVPCESAEEGS